MNLSKTTSYAMRILTLMAKKEEAVYSSEQLYDILKIPHKYLRRLLTELSKQGFIKSTRGRTGGFVFAKSLNEITLYDIIDKTEGYDKMNVCILGMSECILSKQPCALHAKWCEAREKITQVLKETTLNDLKIVS